MSEPKRLAMTRLIWGEEWIARYLGHQDRIDEAHTFLEDRLRHYAVQNGLQLVTEPTSEIRYDEIRGEVLIMTEALGVAA